MDWASNAYLLLLLLFNDNNYTTSLRIKSKVNSVNTSEEERKVNII